MQNQQEPSEFEKIAAETALIPWLELQRFFASGLCLQVAPTLDLVDVAQHIARDDKSAVESWLDQGLLAQVSDQQAMLWVEQQAQVWAVVIKPWVLVQELKPKASSIS